MTDACIEGINLDLGRLTDNRFFNNWIIEGSEESYIYSPDTYSTPKRPIFNTDQLKEILKIQRRTFLALPELVNREYDM